jgi:hypothetical protein
MKYFILLSIFFIQFSFSQGCDPKKMNLLGAINCNVIKTEAKPWVKGKDMPWESFNSFTVGGIEGFVPSSKNVSKNIYGSDSTQKFNATGFFRVEKQGNRWWVIDPLGYRNIQVVINSLRAGKSERNIKEFDKRFGDSTKWLSTTADSLNFYGFNGSGSWSEDEQIQDYNKTAKAPLTFTPNLNFMSGYGKKRGGTVQLPGNTGYPNQCIFVFDTEFETYCDERAKELVKYANDTNLFGYFSDNEMPLGLDNLQGYLKLENKSDPGYLVASKWMEQKGITIEKITEKDKAEFAGIVADKYFSVVSKAIKKYDPNHLYLGSRLHGGAKKVDAIVAAAGKYCDILSINYYGSWSLDPTMVDMWNRVGKKPFIITEFYTKAMDAGLANTSGAGFTVRTQKDRGIAYQHFTLSLLASKSCVGWHYFKYQDNDPTAKNVDPSNTDANKGIVNNNFEYYKPLMKLMKELNDNKYNLIAFLESESARIKALEPLDIIFAIGQSNMAGRSPIEDYSILPNVYLMNADGNFEPASQPLNKYSNIRKELKIQGVSPSKNCMLSLQKSFNKPLGLVQNAQGGSVINQWFKPGKINYDSSLIRAKEAQKHGKLKAIIWHQGSSDAKDAKQDNFVSYKAKLKEMVENFRKDLNEPELPFICGELSEREDFIAFNSEVIRKVKEYIPNSDYVSSEGTRLLEDNIHFDAESANKLGNRYAEKVLLFVPKK